VLSFARPREFVVMPLTPAALPPVLAGPILRRVEADLVSVWIATPRRCDVSLLLFNQADVIAPESVADDPRAKWVSAAQSTRQVGANLHVLTVVLDLRTPGGNAIVSNGSALEPNLTYSYDLRIFDGVTRHSLRSLGYLKVPTPLGYDPDELPSFRMCPQEREKLVIVHGSCRQLFTVPPVQDDPIADEKPFLPPGGWPGKSPAVDSPKYESPKVDPKNADEFPDDTFPYLPKRDGMIWVDELIAARGPTAFVDRPHQLFLTGDQIYADQPSAVLLPALNNLARLLVGPEDAGITPTGDRFEPVTLEIFPPAFRADVVHRSGGLSTSDGESHLISFGEFVAYYLLTWSPALWDALGAQLWPDDFQAANVRMPEDWRVRFLFDDDRGIGDFSNAYAEFLKNLPDDAPRSGPDAHAQYYFEQLRAYVNDKYWTPDLFEWWTRRFKQQLPRVRRALANVATYMVADDHDISDDWYFSRAWREQVFTRPLGVDIIRNGMMAVVLMQSWGNDPRRWSAGVEKELLDRVTTYAPLMAQAAAQHTPLARTRLDRLHELLGLPHTPVNGTPPTFRPLVEFSYQIEGPSHRVLAIDGRTKRRFPTRTSQAGGIDYEGATGRPPNDDLPTGLPGEEATGLFGDSPMAAALPPRPQGDTKLTIVVTGVPVIGPEGMELALVPFQRLARLLGDVDAEAWSYEPTTYEALLAVLAQYEGVVLLSGDIHIGYSAVLDYWSAPPGGPKRTARIAQLVSSGLTKDWGSLSPPLRNHALSLDVFESATNPSLMHAERVGWGSPVRTAVTPPVPLGNLVTHPERAHPFYRARLKTHAPVVPTHGWPSGTQEVQEPNWAWRAVMIRDARPETTQPPNLARRWTPVELPSLTDQMNPQSMGWHARAAQRESYGRIFAVNQNIGVVTFELIANEWSVRHVLAGEVPPLPETGAVPTGLQPFIVHQFTLAPKSPGTWDTERPQIVDDGGWGVDTSEPTFRLLVESLPRIWAGAAEFVSAVYGDLPPVLDGITREALITDAAARVSTPFRRRVLRQLGPFALLPDENLDAVTNDQVAALLSQTGRLNADKEARALVRPDLERLLAFKQSLATPEAMFDDLLLLACSEWVYERNAIISTIAGVIATFRSPVTKHVPILRVLLGGLWDLWRNRTYAEYWTKDAVSPTLAGLLSIPPRVVMFVVDLLLEAVINLVQDLEPRFNGGPAVLTPELVVTGAGVALSLNLPKRFTFVSGWEPTQTPLAPGTRATGRTAEALARQTLTMMMHPGGRARYEAPAQKLSATMIPPDRDSSDAEEMAGSLLIGSDGGLETEIHSGAVVTRLELDGRLMHRIMWGGSRFIDGRLGRGAVRASVLLPTRLDLPAGVNLALTPSISLALELKGAAEEGSFTPGVTLRFALNDREDRVTFLPDDEFLGQLLPRGGLALPIDAAWEWTLENGFRFVGFGEISSAVMVDPTAPKREEPKEPPHTDFDEPPPPGANRLAEVVTPMNKRVGVISFHERRLEVITSANDEGMTLDLAVTATVSVNIGPVRIAVAGLGIGIGLRLQNTFEKSDDLFGYSISVPTPTALALSITADSVSGGGFIQRFKDPSGAVTWRGALALRLGQRFEVTAFGIVQTGGGKPYSLLILFTLRFSPPVHLTVGLKLVAVGGLVALNRTMNLDALSTAARATTSQSNLDALLFPDHPEQRFLELVPALDRFFPFAPDHQVFGLLAEIEWRADTGTKFGDFRFALLGEPENLQFALYGIARLGMPSVDEPAILRVRASIEALYDHKNQFARFAITLTEAFLFERVHLTGGAALLIKWGDDPNFALTFGGFHPAYRPFIPRELTEPPRIGAFWKPHDLIELSLQLYFARTAFSLQFGFSAHVKAGASWGGLRADADFNFLVMIAPEVRFEVDLSLRVTVFLFGADLISASFSGSLTGPCRWRFEGSVYWEVCGVSISKDLGPYEWGDPPRLSTTEQEARQLLGDALNDTGNWTIRRSPSLPVRLRAAAQDALDPRDEIDIRQSVLPLGVAVEVNDANPLADGGTWTLRPTSPALARISDLKAAFPTRRYLERPPKETPFRGDLGSGIRVGGKGWTFRASLAVDSDEELTDDLVLDSLPQPPRHEPPRVRVPFPKAILQAAPAQSAERRWTRHAIRLETVA
jgi:hypothetical protein